MTIKKVKYIFDARTSRSQYVLHSLNEHTKVKRGAKKFSVAMMFLLLAVFSVLIGFLLISDIEIFPDEPFIVKFILTPQDLQSLPH